MWRDPTTLLISLSVLGCVGGLLYLVVTGFVAHHFLRADHHAHEQVETPDQRGLTPEKFRFEATGGRHIAGWFLRTPNPFATENPTVLMIHGFDSGKDKLWTFDDDPNYKGSMLDQGAESLVAAGFHVVAIDLRGHGESDDHGGVTLGYGEAEDILETLDYLTANASHFQIDVHRIGVRGESMGAASAMIAAAKDDRDRVAALWLDSAFADAPRAVTDFLAHAGVPRWLSPGIKLWLQAMTGHRLEDSSPKHYLSRIECPVLMTHSSDDTMIPVRHFEELANSDSWPQPPETWQLHDYEHNRLWSEPTYHARQVEFFRRTLVSRTPRVPAFISSHSSSITPD